MTLVNRVLTFFLTALALVLIAYSTAFYGFVGYQLRQEFDQQLQSALATLVAAIEVEDDSAKWQPTEHAISPDTHDALEEVRWAVFDDTGMLVDHSPNISPELADDAHFLMIARQPAQKEASLDIDNWRFMQHSIQAAQQRDRDERDSDEYNGLVITVARSQAELDANLQRLALLVCLLPVGVWLVAAAVGRWFCARAVQPVLDMAAQVRAMSGNDFRRRLPATNSQDEVAGLGAAFNGLLDQLQQVFEQQRRFTGDAAHQLRTPLAVLLGQVDVALRRPRSTEEYQRTLALLRSETVELQQIVEALLFLARAEEDASLPDLQPLALDDWLPAYLRKWNEHPRHADLTLNVARDSRVLASSSLLSQLLDNLISNALKYSEPDTPVVLSARRNDAQVLLSVEDHGQGIAPEDRQAIFTPFFRSQAARQSGIAGTGLGLAIAARIANAMSGKLECESTPGVGSTFRLVLPAHDRRADVQKSSDSSPNLPHHPAEPHTIA